MDRMKSTGLGDFIKEKAATKKLPLSEIASSMGISKTHLVNIINGHRVLTRPQMFKLGDALKLTREESYVLNKLTFTTQKNIKIEFDKLKPEVVDLLYILITKGRFIPVEKLTEAKNQFEVNEIQKKKNKRKPFNQNSGENKIEKPQS